MLLLGITWEIKLQGQIQHWIRQQTADNLQTAYHIVPLTTETDKTTQYICYHLTFYSFYM